MAPDRKPNEKSDTARKLNVVFGENIKQIRTAKGYSQKQLADMCGVSQSVISSWERGSSEANLGYVDMLARVLNVPMTALIPVDESVSDADRDRYILDIVHQDPRWGLLFDKRKNLSDSDWNAVFSIMNAITKEREGNA